MTPSNLSILLGIALLLLLPAATSADEPAARADLEDLASREQQLRVQVDEQLSAWVVAVTDDYGEDLGARMTHLLQPETRRASRPDDSTPPAKRAWADAAARTAREGVGDTACTTVGDTLVCELREHAAR